MIKKIKVKKQMRLDELIKHAFDNNIKSTRFNSDNGAVVHFDNEGNFTLDDIFYVKKTSTFTVEVEEEITEDTDFDYLVEIDVDGDYFEHGHNISIKDVKDEDSLRFYAVMDKKLELVWEADSDE